MGEYAKHFYGDCVRLTREMDAAARRLSMFSDEPTAEELDILDDLEAAAGLIIFKLRKILRRAARRQAATRTRDRNEGET